MGITWCGRRSIYNIRASSGMTTTKQLFAVAPGDSCETFWFLRADAGREKQMLFDKTAPEIFPRNFEMHYTLPGFQ